MKFELGSSPPEDITRFELKVTDGGETVSLNVNGIMVMFFNKNTMTVDFSRVLVEEDMPFPVDSNGYMEVER